jgi:hypothetical protein
VLSVIEAAFSIERCIGAVWRGVRYTRLERSAARTIQVEIDKPVATLKRNRHVLTGIG